MYTLALWYTHRTREVIDVLQTKFKRAKQIITGPLLNLRALSRNLIKKWELRGNCSKTCTRRRFDTRNQTIDVIDLLQTKFQHAKYIITGPILNLCA
jgi:hypothetical protein